MKDTKNLLKELNFKIDSEGIIYWLEAIKIIQKNPLELRTCKIYEKLAKKFKTDFRNIERSMRFAINPAKEAIKKRYDYKDKITNNAFLALIRLEIYK